MDVFTTNTAIDAGLIDRPLEREFGDYGPNRYAWATDNPIKLPFPLPCNGMLGLWTVPNSIERQIIIQVRDKMKPGRMKLGEPESLWTLEPELHGDWLKPIEPNPTLVSQKETIQEYFNNRLHGEWVKPNDDQS